MILELGVGAFGDAMERLHQYGLVDVIREAVKNGTPLLGICLGLQLLFERSDESDELDAQTMGKIKRKHWAVENELHHVLDDSFREDRSPARTSRNMLALIRKYAYNLLRLAMLEPSNNPGKYLRKSCCFISIVVR